MFLGKASVPEGLVVYAIGDVHGYRDLLAELLEKIDADFAAGNAAERRIVTVGDYCDRGPDSSGVFELLSRRVEGGELVCLRGNHDQYILDFLDDPFQSGAHWLRMGGRETVLSYGIDREFEPDPQRMAREFARALPRRHLDFLQSTRFSHEIGDYFFAHAGVRPGRELEHQDPHDLMWIRKEFHDHAGDFGKVVVHGHTPHDAVEVLPNRINIDTGVYMNGLLSCVRLEGTKLSILQVSGRP